MTFFRVPKSMSCFPTLYEFLIGIDTFYLHETDKYLIEPNQYNVNTSYCRFDKYKYVIDINLASYFLQNKT